LLRGQGPMLTSLW